MQLKGHPFLFIADSFANQSHEHFSHVNIEAPILTNKELSNEIMTSKFLKPRAFPKLACQPCQNVHSAIVGWEPGASCAILLANWPAIAAKKPNLFAPLAPCPLSAQT